MTGKKNEAAVTAEQKAENAAAVLREAEAAARAPARVAEDGDPNMALVSVRVPLNPAHPDDNTVTVGLNGKLWQIQRGKTVQVPKAVVEILEHAEAQQAATLEYMQSVMN